MSTLQHRPRKNVRAADAALSNDESWAILYGALVNQLNVSPKTFQLLYPFTSWNWPTNNLGFTNSAQYDFCATVPQWSATGKYDSSGSLFNNQYQQFLNCILAATTNPQLQAQIAAAQNHLTTASNNLGTIVAEAQSAYASDPSVVNNVPTYTVWLAGDGAGYNGQIEAANTALTQAQAVLNTLLQEQTTPNLAAAQAAMLNPLYKTKLQDPSLSGFPPVPGYSISIDSASWVAQVQGGGGTPSTFTFTNSDDAYDYSQSWANQSQSVDLFFWGVYSNNSWQSASVFQSDSSLSCTLKFAASDSIGITPSLWYSGTTAFRNGPFQEGDTAYQTPQSNNWMFGEGGIIPAMKTGMLVCYQPSVEIEVSQSTYQQFTSQFSHASGLQIGPFQVGGDSSGGSSIEWSSSGSSMKATCVSTSTTPLIVGVDVAILPA